MADENELLLSLGRLESAAIRLSFMYCKIFASSNSRLIRFKYAECFSTAKCRMRVVRVEEFEERTRTSTLFLIKQSTIRSCLSNSSVGIVIHLENISLCAALFVRQETLSRLATSENKRHWRIGDSTLFFAPAVVESYYLLLFIVVDTFPVLYLSDIDWISKCMGVPVATASWI